jgi:hypothetical protein
MAASRMSSAISVGVFWRLAPSTSEKRLLDAMLLRRFLYSTDSDFALAQSMLEETPELGDPRNARIGVRSMGAEL